MEAHDSPNLKIFDVFKQKPTWSKIKASWKNK